MMNPSPPSHEAASDAQSIVDRARDVVHASEAHGTLSQEFRDAVDALARSVARAAPAEPEVVQGALRMSVAACVERAQAATLGPWRVGSVAAEGKVWAPYAGGLAGPHGERCLLSMNPHFAHDADRRFIAHARDDVPFLAALALRHAGVSHAR